MTTFTTEAPKEPPIPVNQERNVTLKFSKESKSSDEPVPKRTSTPPKPATPKKHNAKKQEPKLAFLRNSPTLSAILARLPTILTDLRTRLSNDPNLSTLVNTILLVLTTSLLILLIAAYATPPSPSPTAAFTIDLPIAITITIIGTQLALYKFHRPRTPGLKWVLPVFAIATYVSGALLAVGMMLVACYDGLELVMAPNGKYYDLQSPIPAFAHVNPCYDDSNYSNELRSDWMKEHPDENPTHWSPPDEDSREIMQQKLKQELKAKSRQAALKHHERAKRHASLLSDGNPIWAKVEEYLSSLRDENGDPLITAGVRPLYHPDNLKVIKAKMEAMKREDKEKPVKGPIRTLLEDWNMWRIGAS